jgi:hypothetical protein
MPVSARPPSAEGADRRRTSALSLDAVVKAKPAGAKGNYVKRVAISVDHGPWRQD